MTNNYRDMFRAIKMRCLPSLMAFTVIAACTVNSTSVQDENLIVDFLVQNDNGTGRAVAHFRSRDLSGDDNTVDLVDGETVSYLYSGNDIELRSTGDGEYSKLLPTAASGWYLFVLHREGDNGLHNYPEIGDTSVYLPDAFQALLAEPVQSGKTIEVSWESLIPMAAYDSPATIETYSATAECRSGDNLFEVSIDERATEIIGQLNNRSVLAIDVYDHLTQVDNFSPEIATMASCDFDVQLIRKSTGVADGLLSDKSTATGQVLTNFSVQWFGQ